VWKGIIVLLGLVTLSQAKVTGVRAQSPAGEAQLTILVRDADGNPLEGIWLSVYLPRAPAEPRKVAEARTGEDGRLTIPRLDPAATYVIQFDSGVPDIVDGEEIGSKSMQFTDHQNAGRELSSPADPPGFPVALGGETEATLRFVIGGTFSEGDSVAAVPMFDLAETDDAPVRPVNPLTGDEMTPEQARTFHAVIGEPWGVARGAEASPEELASSAAPGPVASVEAVPLPSAAAGGTTSTSPAATPGASPLTLVLVATIVAMAVVIGVLLLRQRRRPG